MKDSDLLTDPTIDWSATTFAGNRLDQHRQFLALSFERKLELVDDLSLWTKENLGLAIAKPKAPSPQS